MLDVWRSSFQSEVSIFVASDNTYRLPKPHGVVVARVLPSLPRFGSGQDLLVSFESDKKTDCESSVGDRMACALETACGLDPPQSVFGILQSRKEVFFLLIFREKAENECSRISSKARCRKENEVPNPDPNPHGKPMRMKASNVTEKGLASCF